MRAASPAAVVVCALAAALAVPAAPVDGAEVTLAADARTAYVWRGLTFADGPVVQPSLEVSGLRLGTVPLVVEVWSNFNLDDWDGQLHAGQFSEFDLTLTAGLPHGFELGFIEYVFAIGGAKDLSRPLEPSTREAFVSWTREGRVTPTLRLYYDVEQIRSPFLLASAERGFVLPRRLVLSLGAELGLAGGGFARYYGGTKGGLYHGDVSAALGWKAGDRSRVSVTLGYARGFSERVRPSQPAGLRAGLGAALTF
jgi:hypothetical protein